MVKRLFLLLASLLILEHLLDNLLLLNQEGTDNAVANAVAAPRTTVGTLDGLLGLADGGILAGTESGDLERYVSTEYKGQPFGVVRASSWG